jgi:hypothetical protein
MLEYVYALSLLSITITLFYLTRSCFQFKGEIPYQGEEISSRIDKVHGVLDELADIINDISQSSPIQEFAQTPSNPLMAIAQAFLTPKPIPVEHGSKTQEEWQIHEVNEKNTTQAENELS